MEKGLAGSTEECHDNGTYDKSHPKIWDEVSDDRIGHEGTEHIEGPVSEVDDTEHSKDDRQTEGENDIDRSQDEPVKKLHNDELDIHSDLSYRSFEMDQDVYLNKRRYTSFFVSP